MAEHRRRLSRLLLAVVLLPGLAAGHGLGLFAAADGPFIDGEVHFAGGHAATDVRIEVHDGQGGLLAELTPDAAGRFHYRAQAPVDHRIVADSADGHRAEWVVHAGELAPGFAAAAGEGTAAAEAGQRLSPALSAAIEQAVARQLRPLREELAAARSRAGLRDVLGGLGWIAGVAGLALWWRGRGGGAGGQR
jgi:nickel transport protein